MKTLITVLLLVLVTANINKAKAQTVMLDYYFNREYHQENGVNKRFHYLWDDNSQNGFSVWAEIFRKFNAKTDTLSYAPTAENLKRADIYIIVDPDNKKDNPSPNYISKGQADVIAEWVKKGGVLVMLANDSSNTDLPTFNLLAQKFDFQFNNNLVNHVATDAHFDDGAVTTLNKAIFPTTKKAFMKDVCSVTGNKNFEPVFSSPDGAVVAAVITYGNGKVLAAGDPWLYNEYVNGRLPQSFDNFTAAKELTQWLLKQVHRKY